MKEVKIHTSLALSFLLRLKMECGCHKHQLFNIQMLIFNGVFCVLTKILKHLEKSVWSDTCMQIYTELTKNIISCNLSLVVYKKAWSCRWNTLRKNNKKINLKSFCLSLRNVKKCNSCRTRIFQQSCVQLKRCGHLPFKQMSASKYH